MTNLKTTENLRKGTIENTISASTISIAKSAPLSGLSKFSTIRFAQPAKNSEYTPKTTGVGCVPLGGGGSPA